MHAYKKYDDSISYEYNTGGTISLPQSSKVCKKIGRGSDEPQNTDSRSGLRDLKALFT